MNKRNIVLVVMSIIFMMTYSSLLGTPKFTSKLNNFVNENNLSHKDIDDIANEISKMNSEKNDVFAKELKKIGKRKKIESNSRNEFHVITKINGNIDFFDDVIRNRDLFQNDRFFEKRKENDLRIRE
ncbi:hypothetical protein J5A73_04110 [Leptotrichia sp. oral taxon 218]|uniref:hypothetical protein n=1 Tax=Leptotrichia sp. oral taxon 218 TaxID=712361 RepID=UPI001B8C4786|nr:hypothetical protein [Leptotrichia sp. oral taxon 218]QUB96039.1 hypothetical protein J5A73_04110 [Leptotrichia sp. oral taxon 218]